MRENRRYRIRSERDTDGRSANVISLKSQFLFEMKSGEQITASAAKGQESHMVKKRTKTEQFEIKPNDVFAPPDSFDKIPPPLTVRKQELPLNELSWKDFERLCFRLAGRGQQAEHWQRYGRQGQAQGGMDIFVRRTDGKYDVWQCKRYQRFTAPEVVDAVDMFVAGEREGRAAHMVLCVTP